MKKRGFTLIELLVVISIGGILVALLLPAITGVLNKSKKSHDHDPYETYGETITNDGISVRKYTMENGMIRVFVNGVEVKNDIDAERELEKAREIVRNVSRGMRKNPPSEKIELVDDSDFYAPLETQTISSKTLTVNPQSWTVERNEYKDLVIVLDAVTTDVKVTIPAEETSKFVEKIRRVNMGLK